MLSLLFLEEKISNAICIFNFALYVVYVDAIFIVNITAKVIFLIE